MSELAALASAGLALSWMVKEADALRGRGGRSGGGLGRGSFHPGLQVDGGNYPRPLRRRCILGAALVVQAAFTSLWSLAGRPIPKCLVTRPRLFDLELGHDGIVELVEEGVDGA